MLGSAALPIRFRQASAKKRRAAMALTVVVISGAWRAGDVHQRAKAKFTNQDGR